MRLLVHVVLVLMIVGLLAGVAYFHSQHRTYDASRALARSETLRFQRQIHLQAALADNESREMGYPPSVDPAWFQGNLPVNPLLTGNHPWLEVAGAQDAHRRHPPSRTADTPEMAAFWYNPYNGVVRARVPAGVSDAQALDLYNAVNDSDLGNLFTEP